MMRGLRSRRQKGAAGQSLVLMVLSLVAMLAGAALVVDGGNAFSQQRGTQNAVDSTAEAGAVELSANMIAAARNQSPLPKNDANILAAVNNAANFNSIQTPVAYYTTLKGRCVKSDGSTSAPPCDAVVGAVRVGSAAGGQSQQ